MNRVLVTGGTGRLGRVLGPALLDSGYQLRIATRRPDGAASGRTQPDPAAAAAALRRAQRVRVDLVSGDGLAAAVADIDAVVHLATTNGRRDQDMALRLVHALQAHRPGPERVHLVYLSIVGADRIPLPYYRHKTVAEETLLGSGLPVTVLRSTQFHTLVGQLFEVQRRLPRLLVPRIAVQPIDVRDVAARLVELVGAEPAGRVPDIGGPETVPLADLAGQWQAVRGHRRGQTALSLPGRVFAAYRAGYHLVPGIPYGTVSFQDALVRRE